ncbi:hypothetical protein HDU90_001198 [Geranomyces variabilis]|nr:hypothetical protein HDU90_001198 [Geranomyces variabilis]
MGAPPRPPEGLRKAIAADLARLANLEFLNGDERVKAFELINEEFSAEKTIFSPIFKIE